MLKNKYNNLQRTWRNLGGRQLNAAHVVHRLVPWNYGGDTTTSKLRWLSTINNSLVPRELLNARRTIQNVNRRHREIERNQRNLGQQARQILRDAGRPVSNFNRENIIAANRLVIAPLKIQAAWRGYQARKKVRKLKAAQRNWAPGGRKANILAIRYPMNNRPRLTRSKSTSPYRSPKTRSRRVSS